MPPYLALKYIHITCAAISITLFILRFYWRMSTPDKLKKKWVRVVPHLIDTLLLISAISLAIWSHQYPIAHSWLSAKVMTLVFYIGFGMMAFKAQASHFRVLSFACALVVFSYIVSVALSKQVVPFYS